MIPYAGTEERALADGVAAVVRDLAPRIADAEAQGTLPADIVSELARAGVLALTIPESEGGLGASSVAFALALEEIAAVWPALAVAVSVNGGIVAGSVARYGTAEQRALWLPRLMDGGGLGGFALTEPTSGSDAASLRSTARRDGDEWVLRGEKLFVTNARYAPFIIVLARVGERAPAAPAHAGITAFIVPAGTPGLAIGAAEKKMGLLASDTSAVTLDDVRLPADALLGEVGKGFGIAMAGLDAGRIGIAAQAVGISRGALERGCAYATTRTQFGTTVASFQGVRFPLATARAETCAARLMTLRAAWLKDASAPFTREAAMAKLYATECAQRVTYAALQVFGGYGYMREYEIERYARDARATTIYEGTSEVQRMVIARHTLAAGT